MMGCSLTTEQLSVLLSTIRDSAACSLRDLNIRYNELEGVEAVTLVGAMARLQKVDIFDTWLTPDSVALIFRMVAERGSSSLQRIILGSDKISSVPASLCEEALFNKDTEIL